MASSVVDGAKEVLFEAISTLIDVDRNCRYVVIGGWCPYLRKCNGYSHPGTFDVDILFEKAYEKYELSEYIIAMMSKEYYPSAKHSFQLLKKINVGAEGFIYNVDLLHPGMIKENPDLFVDHLDLDVFVDKFKGEKYKEKSIILPGSEIIFDEILFDMYELGGLKFNLLTYEGMFLTKTISCQKVKRERDCYDIFLGFKSGEISSEKIRTFCKKYSYINASVEDFIEYINNPENKFDEKVLRFSGGSKESASKYIIDNITA